MEDPTRLNRTMPIEWLAEWAFAGGGLRLGDLRLDDGASQKRAPEVTVEAVSSSKVPVMVGVFVAFFDEGGRLLASACLAPPGQGIIAPGAKIRLQAELPMPREDIGRIRRFAVRVTWGKVHPMETALLRARNHS